MESFIFVECQVCVGLVVGCAMMGNEVVDLRKSTVWILSIICLAADKHRRLASYQHCQVQSVAREASTFGATASEHDPAVPYQYPKLVPHHARLFLQPCTAVDSLPAS